MTQDVTQVVNLRREPHDVYIGRPRAGMPWNFGNPFHLGPDGSRNEVIAKYEAWLREGHSYGNRDATPERREWILANLESLRGKRLGCFCSPAACHGDVLVQLLQERAAVCSQGEPNV